MFLDVYASTQWFLVFLGSTPNNNNKNGSKISHFSGRQKKLVMKKENKLSKQITMEINVLESIFL